MKRMHIGTLYTIIVVALCSQIVLLNARPKKKRKPTAPEYTLKHDPSLVVSDAGAVITNKPTPKKKPEKKEQSTQHLLATIQEDLHKPQYRQEILPHNFSYMSQLLQHGSVSKQAPEYAQNVISLFSKLLKGSEYVNSYVFSDLIQTLPEHLKHYLGSFHLESSGTLLLSSDLDMLERMERTISHLVFNKFTQDFDTCKTNPRLFLDDLSKRVFAATTQEVNMELLRQTLVRFLEVGLGKLVWSPKDPEQSWQSVKNISDRLATLMEQNVIGDLNDLDDLYWSLLHRYRYFLEIHGSDLSLAFYQKLKAEITESKISLLDLAEQESFIESKASCLLHTVLAQEAKKRMYDMPGQSHVV